MNILSIYLDLKNIELDILFKSNENIKEQVSLLKELSIDKEKYTN